MMMATILRPQMLSRPCAQSLCSLLLDDNDQKVLRRYTTAGQCSDADASPAKIVCDAGPGHDVSRDSRESLYYLWCVLA